MKLLALTLAVLCVTLAVKASEEKDAILKRLLNLLEEKEKRAQCSSATSPVSLSQQQDIVNKHNELRAGEGSSNMRQLRWSQELADIAQQNTDRNVAINSLEHSHTQDCSGESSGQNAYMASNRVTNLEIAVPAWFSEKQFTVWGDYGGGYCPRAGQQWPGKPGQQIMCGHYTQVVWAKTDEVGCGVSYTSSGGTYFTCNYRIGGNMQGANMYLKGAACSECGFDDTWDSGYKCDNRLCAPCVKGTSGCTTPGPNCDMLCKDVDGYAANCQNLASNNWCGLAGNKAYVEAYCRGSCQPENCPASCGGSGNGGNSNGGNSNGGNSNGGNSNGGNSNGGNSNGGNSNGGNNNNSNGGNMFNNNGGFGGGSSTSGCSQCVDDLNFRDTWCKELKKHGQCWGPNTQFSELYCKASCPKGQCETCGNSNNNNNGGGGSTSGCSQCVDDAAYRDTWCKTLKNHGQCWGGNTQFSELYCKASCPRRQCTFCGKKRTLGGEKLGYTLTLGPITLDI